MALKDILKRGGLTVAEAKTQQRKNTIVLYSSGMSLAVFALWLLINISGEQLKWSLDASEEQFYTLSETSHKILNGLEQPVQIYALFRDGQRPSQPIDVWRILQEYSHASKFIELQELNPELEPQLVSRFNSKEPGAKAPEINSIIVSSGNRFRVIQYPDLFYISQRFGPKNASIRAEQQLSSAIAYVSGASLLRLGLVQGHREVPLAALGASGVRMDFEPFNMVAEDLNIETKLDHPLAQYDVLLAYKPQLDLSEEAYQALRSYLDGGKALWLILDFQAPELERWYQLAKDYGLEILPGVVLERNSRRINPRSSGYTTFVTPIEASAPEDGLHPILEPLKDQRISEFLWTNTMALRESVPKPVRMKFISLVKSSSESLLRSSRDPSILQEQEGDITGPLTLMGMSVWQNLQGKRSGPAFMLSFDLPGVQTDLRNPSNQQLFYSALSWLGRDGQQETLVFPSKSLLMLGLQLNLQQALLWAAIFTVLLPAILIGISLVVLRKRRYL